MFTFNSARKSMSTVIPLPGGGYRLFTKGASEIVLSKCTSILKDGGNIAPLTSADHRQIISTIVRPMAGRSLRTIALAYRYLKDKGGKLQQPRGQSLLVYSMSYIFNYTLKRNTV